MEIPKEDIDETNPFLEGTMFSLSKNAKIGSGRDTITLTSDEHVTYQLLSGRYDSVLSTDSCLVDKDKMAVSLAIQMYNLGANYNHLFNSMKDNKYSYLFLVVVLKDNLFTKEIVQEYCDLVPSNYPTLIDCNGDTVLIYACSNNMNDVAIKLIDRFGELTKPDHVNNYGNTALSFAEKHCNTVVVEKIKALQE